MSSDPSLITEDMRACVHALADAGRNQWRISQCTGINEHLVQRILFVWQAPHTGPTELRRVDWKAVQS